MDKFWPLIEKCFAYMVVAILWVILTGGKGYLAAVEILAVNVMVLCFFKDDVIRIIYD